MIHLLCWGLRLFQESEPGLIKKESLNGRGITHKNRRGNQNIPRP